MTHHHALLAAAKAVLDGDATFKSLIKQQGDSSKVILGPGRSRMSQNPTIQMYVDSHDTNQYSRLDTIRLVCQVFTNEKEDGTADLKESSDICERIIDKLTMDNPNVATRLTITSHNHEETTFASLSPIIRPAEVPPEGTKEYGQEVVFNVTIIRKTGV